VVEALKEVECIPVESGGWRKPAHVLVASDAIHELFTSEDVLTLLDADYPSPMLVQPQGVLQRLGCRNMLISDVVDVFGKHADWFAKKEVEWQARFYAYLATSPKRKEFIKSL